MKTEKKYIIFIIIAIVLLYSLNFYPTPKTQGRNKELGITQEIQVNKKSLITIGLFLVGYFVFFIYGVINFARKAPHLKQEYGTFPKKREKNNFGINNNSFLRIINFMLYLYILGYCISMLIPTTYKLSADPHLNLIIIINICWSLLLLFYLNKFIPLRKMGFRNCRREIHYIFKLYSVTLVALVVATIIIGYVSEIFNFQVKPQPIAEIMLAIDNKILLCLLILQIILIAPVSEEILFRGFIFNYLRKNFNWLISSFITSGLFASLHRNIFGFMGVFILSMSLCFLYEKKYKIINPIMLHSLHNTLGVIIMVGVKMIKG